MGDEPAATSKEEAMQRLKELVLDHLGIPRPRQTAHIQALQDELLPTFMELARHTWLAASRLPLKTELTPNGLVHPVYQYLHAATETCPTEIARLKDILEELGVDALFEEVASSPDIPMMSELPIDDYDKRLLRETGHPDPAEAIHGFLRYAATHPQVLEYSDEELDRAGKAMLQAHRDITVIINPNTLPSPAAAPGTGATSGAKPKRTKLFSSLGKLASGLVLLSGNAIVIPTVGIGGVTALPVLGSLAAGIAAVGDGVSYLLREGE